MKKSLLLYALIFMLQSSLMAQKHCDLSLTILTPIEGETIPFGQTAELKFSIKNLGPNDLMATDSVFITSEGDISYSLYIPQIASGDSIEYLFFTTANNEDDDYAFSECLYYVKEFNTSFIDSIQINDTSCVHFILEGRNTSLVANLENNLNQVTLYPNPANDLVNITLKDWNYKTAEVVIMDFSGREYHRSEINISNSNKNISSIPISNLPQGIYLMKIGSNGHWIHCKLIVK